MTTPVLPSHDRLCAGIRSGVEQWGGLGIALLAAVVMLVWTWRAWPDPVVDFGRELDFAWRIAAHGDVLYRDMASFNGPLSPYVNAMWFSIFGEGIVSLAVGNLFIALLVMLLVHRMTVRIAGPLAAGGAALAFVLLFVFAQFTGIGNYNWICPYSHEMTHGIGLSLMSLYMLMRCHQSASLPHALMAGLALGLAFLTKAEVFAAALLAYAAGVAMIWWDARREGKPSCRVTSVLGVAPLAPPLIAWLLLCTAMPPSIAALGVLGSWPHVFNPTHAALPFFAEVMGTDDLPQSLMHMATWAMAYVAVFLPMALVCLLRGTFKQWAIVAIGVYLAAIVGWTAQTDSINWGRAISPAPLILLALLAMVAWQWWRSGDQQPSRHLHAGAAIVLVFSFVLLGKMLFNVRLWHYGFGLAMPATLVLVVALLHGVPAWLRQRGGQHHLFRIAAAVVCLVVVWQYLGAMSLFLDARQYTIGHGADRFRADDRAAVVNTMLDQLDERTRSDHTLVVFPDCPMLNYLSRRRNPTPYVNFLPPGLILFDESRMLDELKRASPDFVVVVYQDTSIYGAKLFGVNYAHELMAWIKAEYEPELTVGVTPFNSDDQFGMLLARRRATVP